MKTLARMLLCIGTLSALGALGAPDAQAQPRREFNQAELDALLAPVALYPDALLSQILVAATYPDQVAEAARGGQSSRWHPAVTALTAFPEVLARMAENPQWLRELGEAYRDYEPYVMETVQQLRRRAEAAGNLRSDERQRVYRRGETIVVQPVYPQVVYVHHYNPMVVYGNWWWTSYRPVVWRHWHDRPPHRPVHVHGTPAPVKLPIHHVSHPALRPQATPQVQHPPVARPAPAARPAPVRSVQRAAEHQGAAQVRR